LGAKKQNFLQGALILSIAAIIVKIIGAVYKIPLMNLIGGEGFGYYNTAYTIFTPLYTIATAGIPVAVISVPIRNMHTPAELCDPADADTAIALLGGFLNELKGEELA